MKELMTEIEIQATPEQVWQALTDFAGYPEWNPFIYRVDGKAGMGDRADIYIKSLGSREVILHCTIVKLEPNRELRWKWHILLPALYGGEHSFTIEPMDANRIRFVDCEVFTGLLVPLFAKDIDTNSRRGFEAMDKALKARAEQMQVVTE